MDDHFKMDSEMAIKVLRGEQDLLLFCLVLLIHLYTCILKGLYKFSRMGIVLYMLF